VFELDTLSCDSISRIQFDFSKPNAKKGRVAARKVVEKNGIDLDTSLSSVFTNQKYRDVFLALTLGLYATVSNFSLFLIICSRIPLLCYA
jgi:hypothetical protein